MIQAPLSDVDHSVYCLAFDFANELTKAIFFYYKCNKSEEEENEKSLFYLAFIKLNKQNRW